MKVFGYWQNGRIGPTTSRDHEIMQSALDALNTLKAGNQRFIANESHSESSNEGQARQASHSYLAGQNPLAIIVGCADSRVPVELIFSQGIGSLFVIRVAGNVVTPPQLGSVEYAVQSFETPLVVVLGHTHCGAVAATIDALERKDSPDSGNPISSNLMSIVDRISPAVSALMDTSLRDDKVALNAQAIRANIQLAADHLRQESPVLEERISQKKLLIVGAEYSLETGIVDFFDGLPA